MNIENLLKNKHKKFFEAAYAVALSGPGCGGTVGFRLGAVIVKKGKILTAKYNCLKTHPKLFYRYQFPFLHAESHAIMALGMDNCVNAIMYVVRITRNNELAMAKPCKECQKLIKDVGIKKVYYTTGVACNV